MLIAWKFGYKWFVVIQPRGVAAFVKNMLSLSTRYHTMKSLCKNFSFIKNIGIIYAHYYLSVRWWKIYNNHPTKCTQLVIYTFIIIWKQWNSYIFKPYRLTIKEYVIYLYIICILVRHPDDGCWCIWNMLGNSSMWSAYFIGFLHEYNSSGKFVYTI